MWCNKLMLLVVIALAAMPLLAQDDRPTAEAVDKPAPIFVESDSLLIDDLKGVSTYKGDVLFRQAGDSLRADVVRIFAEQRQDVEKVVANGQPARFDHKASLPDEEDSWGTAERIEYFIQKELIIFHGQAFFQQGENQFSGPRIEYSAATRQVKAGHTKTDNGRVQIVIHPRNNKAEDKQEFSAE